MGYWNPNIFTFTDLKSLIHFLKITFLFVYAAVMTAFLPCVTFGQIAEVLDAGQMSKFPSRPILLFIIVRIQKLNSLNKNCAYLLACAMN